MNTGMHAVTFGRYPFDSYKLCFVDDMVEETVPLCSFSLCSNRLLCPESLVDTEVEAARVLVHSLASQWSGIHVVRNQRCDTWVVVGISHFMTELFMKKICGNNEYRFRQKTLADRLVVEDVDRPSLHALGDCLHLGRFEMDFMTLKAPLVLFILDRRLTKASGSAGAVRSGSRKNASVQMNNSTKSIANQTKTNQPAMAKTATITRIQRASASVCRRIIGSIFSGSERRRSSLWKAA